MTRRAFTASIAAASGLPHLSAAQDILAGPAASRGIPLAAGMFASADKVLYQSATGCKIDSIFRIASMTKPVTTVAALQLVEQGKVELDEPVGRILPHLAKPDVLTGFDANGKPMLRPAQKQVTLRHLLTHTSGLCYGTWDESMSRYDKAVKTADDATPPLMFEPGTRWQYGTGLDQTGLLVEKLSGMSLEDYFQAKILRPLGMNDTSYILPEAKFERLVDFYMRQSDGKLKANPRRQPNRPQHFSGGGGLYSTAADYVKFMQMILHKGAGILQPKTVASMEVNQIGSATAGKMKSFSDSSADVDMQPGATEKWGLGFLINTTPYRGGRAAGSLAWAGMYNTFFWIDPKSSRCGVLLMQFLPFVDPQAIGLLADFERAVYA